MSVSLLSTFLEDELEKMMNSFWWLKKMVLKEDLVG